MKRFNFKSKISDEIIEGNWSDLRIKSYGFVTGDESEIWRNYGEQRKGIACKILCGCSY